MSSYADTEQRAELGSKHHPWTVRLDTSPTNKSDWLHELEWRVPVPAESPVLRLAPGLSPPSWSDHRVGQPSTRVWPPNPSTVINQYTGMEMLPGDPDGVPSMWPRPAQHSFWGLIPFIYCDAAVHKFHSL